MLDLFRWIVARLFFFVSFVEFNWRWSIIREFLLSSDCHFTIEIRKYYLRIINWGNFRITLQARKCLFFKIIHCFYWLTLINESYNLYIFKFFIEILLKDSEDNPHLSERLLVNVYCSSSILSIPFSIVNQSWSISIWKFRTRNLAWILICPTQE